MHTLAIEESVPGSIMLQVQHVVRRAGLLCTMLICARSVAAAQGPATIAVLQRHAVRIDAAESELVDRGEVMVRLLPASDHRDVAVLGVVRINVSRDVYLRGVLNFRTWLRTPTRTRLGIFSDPTVPSDVSDLIVTSEDASDLRKCRPGSCTTKLSASEMQRAQDQIDWSADDVQGRVTALARQRILHFVDSYRERGNVALPVYDDRPSILASEAFSAVLSQSTLLSQAAPAVSSYLRTFPRGRPGGVSDVMYWSEDVVARLRPIMSITHAVVYTPPEVAGSTLVVLKQLYANHYFEAALEVRDVIDRDGAGDAVAVFVVVERRFRFDNLPRGGILNIRGRAVTGLRNQLVADLRREKTQLERTVVR